MSTPETILKEISELQDMERGKLCPMQGGRYFNHQTWENGRNVVRYVPATEVTALQKSVANHQRFLKLAAQYVTLIVKRTRQRHRQAFKKQSSSPRSRARQKKEE